MESELLDIIILYIGTFDPFHLTHFEEAKNASKYFGAKTRIIPIISPRKKPKASPIALRREVIDLSIEDEDNIIRFLNIKDSYRHYIGKSFAQRSYVYSLMGLDVLLNLKFSPGEQEIFDYADIIVTQRLGHEFSSIEDYVHPFRQYEKISVFECPLPNFLKESGLVLGSWFSPLSGHFIYYVDFLNKGISGTQIRTMLKNNEDITRLMVNYKAAKHYTTNFVNP